MEKDAAQWLVQNIPNTVDNYDRPVQQAKCSECGFTWTDLYSVKKYFRHCPWCGKPMTLEGRGINGENG